MARYVYKMVPAPEKSAKHKGLKGTNLFAATLEEVLNTLGAQGWEYLRAETLPEEVRAGLTSRKTVYRTLLIFRRALPEDTAAPPPPSTAQTAPPPPLLRRTEIRPQPEGAPSLANLFLSRPDRPDPDRGDGS